MSFLVGIFGGSKKQSSQSTQAAGIQGQTSVAGKPIPLLYGVTRAAPNYIWYGDFNAQQQASQSSGGGKGGVGGGGGGKGGGGSSGFTYSASLIGALCEGPVTTVGTAWVNKNITTLGALGIALFPGAIGQAPWAYMQTNHPDQVLAYNNIAYVAAAGYQLGTSPQLPNHNYEVYGLLVNTAGNGRDADPSQVISDILTNPVHGVGFPASRLGNLSTYQAYCLANGLWISPYYDSQMQSSSMIDDIAKATNSAVVWSSGVMTLVPYGDQSITANGYTYTAPSAPLYSLSDDDFLSNSTGNGGLTSNDPVQLTRNRPSDAYNSVKLEWLDRGNNYQPAIVQATDQALINRFGLRQDAVRTFHMFCDGNAAQLSAQLQLQRQQIRNIYSFVLDQRYIALDPMDIVQISDSTLGITNQWVRIRSITENEDLTLSIIAEEYLVGNGNAPLYTLQQGAGFAANYNTSPGDANAPVIFEPTAQLSEALEVWLAVSGGDFWGGCDVWISSDSQTYKNAGRISGSSRTGILTAALPSVMQAVNGLTIDQVNTISVDLSQSDGELASASQSDMLALTTLCYADGEYVAFQNATLTGSNMYNLGTLVRGAYSSAIGSHLSGSQFARIDTSIFKYSFTPDFIGSTIYIKFVGFNIYGGGQQSLADVQAYAYTIKGTAFSSALPNIANLRTTYVAGITQLNWDEVSDFRPTYYEIRQGGAWSGAQILGRVAHPPFNVQGNGTYWVSAYSQPAPGLQVYSSSPQSIVVTGANIVTNVIATYDEAGTGWTGAVSGGAAVVSGTIQTVNSGNILTDADFLNTPNVLGYGAIASGIYTIPAGHIINIGRVAPCQVLISWTALGQNVNDNILTVNDFLNYPDVLDYASSASVNVYPEIALSQDGSTWGAWQKFSAGSYSAMAFQGRMQLQITDTSIKAELTSFIFSVDVPDRDDHYVNQAISSGGTTITFKPDGSSTATPFNGGTAGNRSLPSIQVTILNASAGDDVLVTSVSLSSCTIQVVNGGSGVARNCNLLVQGY